MPFEGVSRAEQSCPVGETLVLLAQQRRRPARLVHEHTEGRGVSIVVDYIGGPVSRATLRALGRQGVERCTAARTRLCRVEDRFILSAVPGERGIAQCRPAHVNGPEGQSAQHRKPMPAVFALRSSVSPTRHLTMISSPK